MAGDGRRSLAPLRAQGSGAGEVLYPGASSRERGGRLD